MVIFPNEQWEPNICGQKNTGPIIFIVSFEIALQLNKSLTYQVYRHDIQKMVKQGTEIRP